MADRTVRIRLEAITSGLQQAFSNAGRAATGFAGGIRTSAGRAGRAMQGLGPIAAGAGIAVATGLSRAVSAAAEFEESAIRLQTQIGLSADAAGELSDAARRVGRETGIGAQEAVDASFFIASAGLRGEDAMLALERAAQGARIGLGETEDIARLTTAAVNAYGSETLDAEQATDQLLAAVKEGSAEAPEFAGAMGQVLPIASEMGVSFGEMAGNIAAMTRTGTDARTASTQLRQVLMNLINPTEQARDALAEVGLSAQGVRDHIREDGLFSALMMLRDAFGDNDEAMSTVFGNARSLMGVLDLLGANSEENARIVESVMNDAAGGIDEAVAQVEDTTRDRLSRIGAGFKDLALDVGNIAKPAVDEFLDGILNGLALVDMALDVPRGRGPQLSDEGALNVARAAVADMTRELEGMERALASATHAGDTEQLESRIAELKERIREVRIESGLGLFDEGVMESLQIGLERNQGRFDAMNRSAEDSRDIFGEVEDAAANLETAIGSLSDIFDEFTRVGMNAEQANLRLEEGWDRLAETLEESTKVYNDAGEVVDEVSATLDINTEAGRANRQAILDQAGAIIDATEANFEKIAAEEGVGDALVTTAGLYEDQVEKLRDVMRQADLTEDEIDEYIQTLGLTPEEIVTTILADDQASGVLADVAAIIGRIPRFTTTTVRATFDPSDYNRAVASAGRAGAQIPHLASGGRARRGQLHVTGEEGAEFFIPDTDGMVVSHQNSRDLARLLGRSDVTSGPAAFTGTAATPSGMAGGDTHYHTHVSEDVSRFTLAEARHQQRMLAYEVAG